MTDKNNNNWLAKSDNVIVEKLSAFVKKVSEVRMVPKTYPG